jgi:hypothetical protein
VRTRLLILVLAIASRSAHSQACPKQDPAGPLIPSALQALRGQLIYHDDLRQWYELRLDQPDCGQTSIQLVGHNPEKSVKGTWTSLERFRGCHIESKGPLDIAGTGYYSLDLFQTVDHLRPDAPCRPKPLFPDYSHLKPAPQVRSYRVDMTLNYGPGDHPIRFRAMEGGHELRPWQAYASYDLTGLFVLYGNCGKGFTVDKVYGPPQSHPGHFTESRDPSDRAAFDPEGTAAAGLHNFTLSYTCVRYR